MPFLLFNKPFGIVTQFSGDNSNLSNHIKIKSIYPAGRLDKKSEGLILLTNDGKLQARISEPKNKLEKHYWVQVEGLIKKKHLDKLINGVYLNDKKLILNHDTKIENATQNINTDITRTVSDIKANGDSSAEFVIEYYGPMIIDNLEVTVDAQAKLITDNIFDKIFILF